MATLIDRLTEVRDVIYNETLWELTDIADTIAEDQKGNETANKIYERIAEIDTAMIDITRLVKDFLKNKAEEAK